jgi:carboxylesterase type B
MSDSVIVSTEYGAVRGIEKISALNERYFGFLGIPFAKSPVGELRFKVCVKSCMSSFFKHSRCDKIRRMK